MLIDQDAVLRAVEHVDDTMFYAERHRRIFRAMISITERGGVVDPLTLSDELSAARRARGVRRQGLHRLSRRRGADGGEHRVSREDRAREGAAAPAHRSLDGDRRRGVRGQARRPTSCSTTPSRRSSRSASSRRTEGFTRIKELLWPTMERIEALQRGGKTITGVASGFNDLDEMTSGFQPADLSSSRRVRRWERRRSRSTSRSTRRSSTTFRSRSSRSK